MRGEARRFPLDEATIFVAGESLARQFQAKTNRAPRFVIGRDTRESGAAIAAAFQSGAENAGAQCVSAGIITTPGVAFLTAHKAADAGVVISASHNPFYDNGIKIFAPDGKKIDDASERAIEKDIFERRQNGENVLNEIDAADKREFVDAERETEAEQLQSEYLNYLRKEFSELSLEGVKIVVDCANGAASALAPQLFSSFGANVTAIFNNPNGRNINDDCGSLHLEKLQAEVLRQAADFGAAFDGDADRALFVDERGAIVDGDATLWAMAQHLQTAGKLKQNTVVATVMSNLGLEVALKNRGIELTRTAVGDKYVLEELLKSGASLGGEQSGHIIFPERSLVGDGMLTALAMLGACAARNARLSELIQGFERFPQILINVRVREKRDFDKVPQIAAAAREVERELGERGRLLLRYSGTENLARVMIEGANQTTINRQARRIASAIEQELS